MESVRGKVFFDNCKFEYGEVAFEDGIITGVSYLDVELLNSDERDTYIIPGLVDIHLHGAVGIEVCDADEERLCKLAKFERSKGITTICPTTMTVESDRLTEVVNEIYSASLRTGTIKGIYLEGPFLNKNKAGAQNPEYLIAPDSNLIKKLIDESKGLLKKITIAPEVMEEFDSDLHKLLADIEEPELFSLGHSEADYDTAKAAFDMGINEVTHLFNAMPPLNHREPGIVGAVFDSDRVIAEMIADGMHVHPAVLRSVFRILGPDRVALISDSCPATGLGDGIYSLGGQKIISKAGKAVLMDKKTLAGSVSTLYDCFKKVLEFGIDLNDAVVAATRTPAKAMGLIDQIGTITVGKRAELLLLDNSYNIKKVIF